MSVRARLIPSPRLWHPFRNRTPTTNPLLRHQIAFTAVFGGIFPGIAVCDSANSVYLAHVIGPQNLREAVTGLTTLGPARATGRTTTNVTIAPMSPTILTTRGLPDIDPHLHIHAVIKG